jgi:transmembrane sensor
MNEHLNEHVMIRYLQDACTPEERTLFEAWLHASEQNRDLFYETKVLWYAARIEHYGSQQQLGNALNRFNVNMLESQRQRKRKIYLQWIRYAAIFSGTVIVWLFMVLGPAKKSPKASITASVAHTDSSKLVILGDGTRVWLNSNSSITYPPQFSNEKRLVTLNGEAYFDVTHDSSHPFIIQTSNISIKVLGTSFNVQAYPGEKQAEAVLVSGSIAVGDSLGNNLAVMKPGEMARFEKNEHKLTIQNVNPEIYTSWRYGQVSLNAASLTTILNKLTEIYQVRFSVAPTLSDSTRYNFTFLKKKTVTEVMDMLCFVAPIRYQAQQSAILITEK